MSGGSGTTNPSLASHLDASHIDLQAWVGCQEATHIGTVPSHSLAHEEQRKGACQVGVRCRRSVDGKDTSED